MGRGGRGWFGIRRRNAVKIGMWSVTGGVWVGRVVLGLLPGAGVLLGLLVGGEATPAWALIRQFAQLKENLRMPEHLRVQT